MNNKYIILREAFDWICIGNESNELNKTEYDKLCIYLKKNLPKVSVLYDYNRLKFINYVGIIHIDNIVIEILPKISLSTDAAEDRKALLFMLSKCRKINVDIRDMIESNIIKQHLINILAKIYVTRLKKEIQRGMHYEYKSEEELLNRIKGKIMITENIKKNPFNKTKVYCKYDEFTCNNMLNAILKRAVCILYDCVDDDYVKSELNIIRKMMVETDDIYISDDILDSYSLNRKSERFSEVLSIAKLILKNSTMDKSMGADTGFSILFEINYLYEEYIGIVLKEVIDDERISLSAQEKNKYLLFNTKKNKHEIALKPDIVIYKESSVKMIIDTKWKASMVNNMETYKQSDIYQMYAYITTYETCEKCILLYPKMSKENDHSIWKLNNTFNDKRIALHEIDLSSYEKTKDELKELIADL